MGEGGYLACYMGDPVTMHDTRAGKGRPQTRGRDLTVKPFAFARGKYLVANFLKHNLGLEWHCYIVPKTGVRFSKGTKQLGTTRRANLSPKRECVSFKNHFRAALPFWELELSCLHKGSALLKRVKTT